MPHFQTETEGETLIITLTNPPYNTLNSDILEEGAAMLEALAGEAPKGGVVLTGAGSDFTRGMDTKIAATFTPADADRARAAINAFVAALHRLPCALVCAVNGHSIGAGGITILCADWTVAADAGQKIGLPEARAGLPFPGVAQAVLDHWLDPVWRRRLALSSELLGPKDAVQAGLADEIVAPEALIDTAIRRAQELSAQPGFKACKRQLRAKANAEIDALLA